MTSKCVFVTQSRCPLCLCLITTPVLLFSRKNFPLSELFFPQTSLLPLPVLSYNSSITLFQEKLPTLRVRSENVQNSITHHYRYDLQLILLIFFCEIVIVYFNYARKKSSLLMLCCLKKYKIQSASSNGI